MSDDRPTVDHRFDGLTPQVRDFILTLPADLRDLIATHDCAAAGCDRYDDPPYRPPIDTASATAATARATIEIARLKTDATA